MARPTIDEYFMAIAKVIATRSTCLRHSVGAVIVKNKHIISTGYNGVSKGFPHCLEIGCIRDEQNIPSGTHTEICRAIHAEQNAIIQAALHGVSTEGGILYCTHQPCIICAKMIVNAGIIRVVYKNKYPDPCAREFFRDASVKTLEFIGKEV